MLKLMMMKYGMSDEGATALEYGLLVAMIALAIVSGVTVFGEQLLGFFNGIGAEAGLIRP